MSNIRETLRSRTKLVREALEKKYGKENLISLRIYKVTERKETIRDEQFTEGPEDAKGCKVLFMKQI